MGRALHPWRVVEARIEGVQSTVAKYMAKRRPGSGQTWNTFLRNHGAGIAAIDFLVVPTINFRRNPPRWAAL